MGYILLLHPDTDAKAGQKLVAQGVEKIPGPIGPV